MLISYRLCMAAVSICFYLWCFNYWLKSMMPFIGYVGIAGIYTGWFYILTTLHLPDILFLYGWFFGSILIGGAIIDEYTFILPNEGMWLLMVIRTGYMAILYSSLCFVYCTIDSLVRAFIVGIVGIVLHALSRGGIGYGDIKWSMAMAYSLEMPYTWRAFQVACLSGGIWAGFMYLSTYRRKERGGYFPFGPFLALGGCVAWLEMFS